MGVILVASMPESTIPYGGYRWSYPRKVLNLGPPAGHVCTPVTAPRPALIIQRGETEENNVVGNATKDYTGIQYVCLGMRADNTPYAVNLF